MGVQCPPHPPVCPQHHMDPSSNFCNYRTALQGATQRSQTANSSREKIVIPVFNLFVKDIYFLHKIHTNHLPNGHINFKVSSALCPVPTQGGSWLLSDLRVCSGPSSGWVNWLHSSATQGPRRVRSGCVLVGGAVLCVGPSGVRAGSVGLLPCLAGTKRVSSRLKAEPTSSSLTKVFKLTVTNLLTLQKFWEISRQIHEFMTWTQVECPFEKDKKIQSYLLTAPIYSEEGERPLPRYTL